MGDPSSDHDKTLADAPPEAARDAASASAPGTLSTASGLDATLGGGPPLAIEPTLCGGPSESGEAASGDEATIEGGSGAARPPRGLPKIPGYEIQAELGRGAMGVVYLAMRVRLNRPCALKMILAGDHASAEAAVRFLAEAEAIARLEHPNIVQIHHIDEHDGRPYFEMEYLPGGSLAERLDGAPRPARDAARLVAHLARAVAEAHRRGIVHRDLKPANILLAADGTPKVADFGLAKSLGADSGVTQTNSILGSPSYMAPEQARGHVRQVGPRSDVYSLGAILYELLTGRPPFRGATVLDTLQLVKTSEPVAPSRLVPGLPRDAETVALKCLEKDPRRRYDTATALADELDRFIEGAPIVARPVPFWERGWKWARRRPAIAALALALHLAFAALLALGAVSYVRIRQALDEAKDERMVALAARNQEAAARARADEARGKADESRNAALAETYRASLSEARALRAGHPPGWRGDALGILSRLARMPTPRRDLVELRTEALAGLGESDVVEVARLEGFRGNVWSLGFSPDSRALATATQNGDLLLWDVERRRHSWQVADPSGKNRVPRWPSQGDPHVHLRFLPDGGMARTTWSHRVEFLDPSGRPSTRTPIDGGTAQALTLDIDRQGHRLAVGWDDGRIELLDAATGASRRTIHRNPTALALSPDGQWLALIGPDHAVQIRPADGDGPPLTLGKHQGRIVSLRFSQDGTTLASTSWDQTAALWDVARREARVTLRGHKEKVTDLAFSPDGNWVATTSHDHTARIWDARTGQTVAVLPGRGFMHTVAFSPDGQYLAVADTRQAASLYQLRGRRERRWLVGHINGTHSLAFHPRLARLASASDDHAIFVWDAESARPLRHWRESDTGVDGLAYSPDGSRLATGGGDAGKGNIRLWDAETGSVLRVLSGHGSAVHSLAFDPSGRRLATGDTGGRLILWDVTTGQILRRENVGPSWIWSIAFVDEGRRLVTAVTSGPIVLYDLESTDPPRRVPVPGGMRRFVVDRARNDLIVAGNGGVLTRVSLRDLTLGHHLDKGHDGAIESLALSPDGRLLATGGGTDRRVILRDASTFEPLLTLPAWTGMVKDLAFDASGRWLAIAGADSDVGLWDLGLAREQLAPLDLAWDQPGPASAPPAPPALVATADRSRPPIPVIRPEALDSAEFEKARGQMRDGVSAYRAGRVQDAVVILEQANERYRALRRAHPDDPRLAGNHGNSLGWLSNALRRTKRPAEALAREREGIAAYESLGAPSPLESYNLALACARLSSDLAPGSAEERERLDARAVGHLRRAIEGNPGRYLSAATGLNIFNRLRGRADFRGMIADAGFPRDPFSAAPPEAAPPRPEPAVPPFVGIGIVTISDPEGARVVRLTPGGPADADGRLRPGDVVLGVEPGPSFAGRPLDEVTAALRGAAGTGVRLVVRPSGSGERAVYELTRASFRPPAWFSELVALDDAVTQAPDDPSPRIARGEHLGRHGDWAGALDDFVRARELAPADHGPWYRAAPLFLALGDLEGYRRHCRAMLDRFGATDDPPLAERTAKACLLAPGPPADPALVTALAERSVTLGANHGYITYFRLARAMAEARSGDPTPAVAELEAVRAARDDRFREGMSGIVLAMAYQKLGRPEEARAALADALAVSGADAPPPSGSDVGAGWSDWLMCRVVAREAEALILYDPIFPADPFRR